ncbi:DNA adenine methylase [Blautia sp. HCP3S3_D9]|uniref:DNA adenine methylase n=1 Tax=Blautia TaxID=572511 RepID=UPI003F8C5E9F
MYYSPLRYPGGKGKLASFMEYMIDQLGHQGGTYIEPFAGGAGIAMELLLRNVVSRIVINDYDKAVWSFWKAILTETDRFVEEIRTVPLTVDEWQKQHEILVTQNDKYSFELGFAAFYLNRTNRSGIIKGGVIGGQEQAKDWKMDVRFKREELVTRIQRIAARKKDIKLYNKDVNSFIKNYVPLYEENALIYFDPPYFRKGQQLYMNFFNYKDHVRIEQEIREHVNCDWIITYDYEPQIEEIYHNYNLRLYDLNYSVSTKRKANELMIFKDGIIIPSDEELNSKKINIHIRPLSLVN